VPSLDDRATRERLRRRAHLIRLRTSAIDRTFGLQTQWGLRRGITALRKPEALDELAEHGVPEAGCSRSGLCSASSTTSTASSRRLNVSCGQSRGATSVPSC
jgi:hypothetical protein